MAGSIVQSSYAVDDSGGTSTTIAATITGVTLGNTLIAVAGWTDTGAITATASDGTAYGNTGAKVREATLGQSQQVFYLENVGAGSHTVTVTLSTTRDFRRLRFIECAGLATASSFDQGTGQGQASPGTGANGISSGASAATTNSTDFVLGFSQNVTEVDPGTGTVTAGTGYVISGTNLIMGVESKSVAATGAQTATFTQSVNNVRLTHVAAFKEAAAGGDVLMSQACL